MKPVFMLVCLCVLVVGAEGSVVGRLAGGGGGCKGQVLYCTHSGFPCGHWGPTGQIELDP